LWKCAEAAGEDLSGLNGPHHLAADIAQIAVDGVRQLREDYDSALREIP
jgi:hypothetical protein